MTKKVWNTVIVKWRIMSSTGMGDGGQKVVEVNNYRWGEDLVWTALQEETLADGAVWVFHLVFVSCPWNRTHKMHDMPTFQSEPDGHFFAGPWKCPRPPPFTDMRSSWPISQFSVNQCQSYTELYYTKLGFRVRLSLLLHFILRIQKILFVFQTCEDGVS